MLFFDKVFLARGMLSVGVFNGALGIMYKHMAFSSQQKRESFPGPNTSL